MRWKQVKVTKNIENVHRLPGSTSEIVYKYMIRFLCMHQYTIYLIHYPSTRLTGKDMYDIIRSKWFNYSPIMRSVLHQCWSLYVLQSYKFKYLEHEEERRKPTKLMQRVFITITKHVPDIFCIICNINTKVVFFKFVLSRAVYGWWMGLLGYP